MHYVVSGMLAASLLMVTLAPDGSPGIAFGAPGSDAALSLPAGPVAEPPSTIPDDVVQQYCVGCHGPESPKGGLRLDQREAALRGGAHMRKVPR